MSVGSANMSVGDTVSVPIVLSEAPEGVSGFSIRVTLDPSGPAEIVGFSLPDYGLTMPELVSGSEVVLQVADVNELVNSGDTDITLATLDITGVSAGSTTANFSSVYMDDDLGNPMSVNNQAGAIEVSATPPPVLTVGSADVDAGTSASIPLVLSEAPNGISGFRIEVTVDHPDIAEIVGIDMPFYGDLKNTSLESGSLAVLEMADVNNFINAGATDITLAALYVNGLDAGSTPIKALVTHMDDDLGNDVVPDVQNGVINVANMAPVVDAGPDATIDEGQTLSSAGSFTDAPSTWTATVDYGDGSGSQQLTLNGMEFGLSHDYAEDGQYTVTVTVTDSHGAADSDTALVTVMNVAPAVHLPADAVVEDGMTYTGAGSFTDPGADSWSASVDYGDGSGPQPLSLDGDSFGLSHQYGDYGVYQVSVTVTDDDGASGSASFQVEIRHVCPMLSGLTNRPRDLDGDHKCEDLNGNGRLDFADIVYLFNNLQSEDVVENAEDFDFNGNGRLDMADLTTLFDMITA